MSTIKLDLAKLDACLKTTNLGKSASNELWEELDSTNTRAYFLANSQAPSGTVVMARKQTAGRGRQGRPWQSPKDAGIYASFILRPTCKKEDIPVYTLALGVAASRAILSSTGVEVGLKWVNDLVVGRKKLGGILAEMVGDDFPPALILGIGINLNLSNVEIPDDLVNHVEWLSRLTGSEIDPNYLLAELALNLEELSNYIDAGDKAHVLDAWRKHSVTLGKQVQVIGSEGSHKDNKEGTALDINEDGALIVETVGGERLTLYAGEISIRNLDGTYC